MASLSFLAIPISETSLFSNRLSGRIPNSLSISQNISISGLGLSQNRLGFGGRKLGRSNVVKISNQTEALVEPTQISEVPLLSGPEAIEKMRITRESYESKQQYLAMYSSSFGGITTDPAAMVIPMDDHMVHRGHGVFDTAAIVDGFVTCLRVVVI